MNILFLIGNGFDLNLGLKTSYDNFYEYYKPLSSTNVEVMKLKLNIRANLENWSDLELELGRYTEEISSTDEFDIIYNDIEDNLAEYLQQEENKLDSNNIDGKKLHEFLAFPERQLLQADMNAVVTFINGFSSGQYNVNVITFNYTKTLEKLLDYKQKSIQIGTRNNRSVVLNGIEHIHGFTNNRMVMGVNDVSQIANKNFHTNQDVLETLVKPECNQIQRHTVDNRCKGLISRANLICIFGSSIGNTDNFWWQLISEQLKRDCKLIIFKKTEPISQRRIQLIARVERRIKNSFLDKTNLNNDEKTDAEKNIFIGINTDMFNIQ